MRKFIWRLRYAVHAWRRGLDWNTAWYCSGCSADDEQLDYFAERNPAEEADVEISYAEYR